MIQFAERYLYAGFFTLVERNIGRGWRQFLKTMNSVNVLVYVRDLDRFVLVRQPRESQIGVDNPTGQVTETIAGRFDRRLTPQDLIIQESQEEAGITLRPEDIEWVNHGQPMTLSAGALSERAYLAYAVIDSSQLGLEQDSYSAPGEDERIERLLIKPDELARHGCEDIRVFALLQFHLLKGGAVR